jgi:predicted metalloprotease with PDZ domain
MSHRPAHTRLLSTLLAFLLAPLAAAQVDYTLAFEPGGKEWRVEARLAGRGEGEFVFHFPLWTPGAYHVAEYGRFVKEIEARDETGAKLALERAANEPSRVVVRGTAKAKEIVLAYRAEPISSSQFSHNVIDVESNRIAKDYAYVNPVSLFGFAPERAQEPVRLAVTLPAGWKAATVLQPDAEGRYQAPSYFRFEDSPFLFSPTLETRTFEVEGKPHTVSVHGRSGAELDLLVSGCQRLVQAGAKLMRGLPYERYHFLYGFVPEAGGSGLEHTESTLILLNDGLTVTEEEEGLWGITAHEFFHLWTAERIHVQEIRAPDLTQELETGTIWVNEGITEYFCRHLLLHAGFMDEEELLASYLEVQIPPGAIPKKSWTDVSRAAASWAGMQDVMHFAARMYMLGPPTIFALDMTLRRATNGERGIHDLVLHLMTEYDAKGRGFGEDELDDILLALAGPSAVEFYDLYIDGPELPDPAAYLDVLGYRQVGEDLVELDSPTQAQLTARRDYFSITGLP